MELLVPLCFHSHCLHPAFIRPLARKVGQLWYEVFDFHTNISPAVAVEKVKEGDLFQVACAMHPHGIVPFHAILWASYCDQYMTDRKTKKTLYGFGAAADVVMYMPFLRNIMGWLTAGPADYKTLQQGLTLVSSK